MGGEDAIDQISLTVAELAGATDSTGTRRGRLSWGVTPAAGTGGHAIEDPRQRVAAVGFETRHERVLDMPIAEAVRHGKAAQDAGHRAPDAFAVVRVAACQRLVLAAQDTSGSGFLFFAETASGQRVQMLRFGLDDGLGGHRLTGVGGRGTQFDLVGNITEVLFQLFARGIAPALDDEVALVGVEGVARVPRLQRRRGEAGQPR